MADQGAADSKSSGGGVVPTGDTVNVAPTSTSHPSNPERENPEIETISVMSNEAPNIEYKWEALSQAETVKVEKMKTLNGTIFKITMPLGMKIVHIPDCFSSFKAIAPQVHVDYAEVRPETEDWIAMVLNSDEKESMRIKKTDFSFFACISAPLASREDVKILCDWGNWVFSFDDQFDNGDLKDDPVNSKKMVDGIMAALRGKTPETFGLAMVHNSIWDRIVQICASSRSPNKEHRYKDTMEGYMEGVLGHVEDFAQGNIPSIDEFIKVRSKAGGVRPIIAMVEVLHKIELPNEVYNHKCLEVFRRVTVDVVLIDNDILSYMKEEREGVPHNLITVLRNGGMSTQEAYDETGKMLQQCYKDWFIAQADLPLWGEMVDREVQKYIEACRNIMLANIHWHFQSDRYFPGMKEVVRKAKIVVVKDH